MKYLALLLLSAAPIFAHHSFAAEFDAKKPVTLKGAITQLDWTNPHIWLHIDATDDQGNVTKWMCEGGNPNTLMRAGWRKDTVKAGDQLTIQGFRAKDGTNTCNTRSVTFPDGKRVFAGSPSDGGPQQ
jgi:Family of unknown function (DUF6152)